MGEVTKRRPRNCYYIPVDGYVDDRGYRVSVVTEDEEGHTPTGIWPNDGTKTLPYFWGHDYNEALDICQRQNKSMGLSDKDVTRIMTSSFPKGLVDA